MNQHPEVDYAFHHLGIPTGEPRPGERYSAQYRMYTSDSPCKLLRVQWHRYEEGSPLHPLFRTLPHVALKVSELDRAIDGQKVLLGPYEPIKNYRVAIIDDGGIPIELVQTSLSDEELWSRAETDSILYADDANSQAEAAKGLATGDRDVVERLEERLCAAMLAGDADMLDGLLADDLVFINQQGQRLGKAEDLAAHRSGNLRLTRLDISQRDIRVFEGGAVVTLRADLGGSFAGTPFAGAFSYTRVWRRQSNRWQVVSAHCSAIAPGTVP